MLIRHYLGCVENVGNYCVTFYFTFQSTIYLVSMHSVEELGTNVPAFLAKLWKMVEDSETNDLICWSPNGTSFYIRDQARFARELLPLYYKHNNMASFVRQLNMYGFHKVVSIESGGLKIDRDDMEFAHQYFLMGHPYLLEHIKRKIPTNKSDDGRAGSKPELVNKVLSEVKSLKGRQDSVDTQLSTMKRENEVLWREVAILRRKHLKQQQIVNKLIQFLVSMVQTSRGGGIGIKRHYPLMLNDITHHTKTSSKLNGNIADVNSVSSNFSPTGPVIHELDPAELLDDCSPAMDDETSASGFDLCDAVRTSSVNIQSPTATSTTSPNDITDPTETVVTADSSTGSGKMLVGSTPEALLELVEKCPLNKEVLITSGSTQPFLATVRSTKGKQRSTVFKGSKRRKSKLIPAMTKPASSLVTIKKERAEILDEPVNVNNFLEIMLPSLVNDEANKIPTTNVSEEVILPGLCDPTDLVTNEENQESSPDAATEAAISAINKVAAQAAAQAAVATSSKTNVDIASKANTIEGELMLHGDEEEESGASSRDLTLACASSSDPFLHKEELDIHLDNMQSDLDNLKELLKGEGYNLDANLLLGVCAEGLGIDANIIKLFGEEALPYGLIMQDENSGKDGKPHGVSDPMVSGSELMTYSSNLLDLTDMTEMDDWSLPAGSGNFSAETNDDELSTPLVTLNSPGFSGATSVASKKKKPK